MKYVLLTLLLTGCFNKKGGECADASRWESKNGQTLQICGNQIKYSRPTPECELEGEFQELGETSLAWQLRNGTCSSIEEFTAACYFAEGVDHGNFVCQELGISATFYRLK